MLRDTMETGSPSPSVGEAAAQPSYSWLDESWQVTMGKPGQVKRERKAASEDPRDLCGICMYADECMHRGTAERPKLYCELFDVDVGAISPQAPGKSADAADDEPLDLAGGLCCNCEHRHNCTIRSKKGTVWHCEEYC